MLGGSMLWGMSLVGQFVGHFRMRKRLLLFRYQPRDPLVGEFDISLQDMRVTRRRCNLSMPGRLLNGLDACAADA
jgi:hypothetical protein